MFLGLPNLVGGIRSSQRVLLSFTPNVPRSTASEGNVSSVGIASHRDCNPCFAKTEVREIKRSLVSYRTILIPANDVFGLVKETAYMKQASLET